MGAASFVQENFQGGEISPLFQGRITHPKYKIGMNVCLNTYPIEEGGCTRRQGTQFLQTTRNGAPGRLIPFDFSAISPYNMEFTDGHLRFFQGSTLAYDIQTTTQAGVFIETPVIVMGISTATPAVVNVSIPTTWATGDQVMLLPNPNTLANNAAILRNRVFSITMIDTTFGQQFSISDPITGNGVPGSTVNFTPDGTFQIVKITTIATPWTNGSWATLRSVQAELQAVLLNGTTIPYTLTANEVGGNGTFSQFSLAQTAFLDGPYLDQIVGYQATPNALSGIVTVTFAFQAYDGGTVYGVGDYVTSSSVDYVSLQGGNVGNTPASSPTFWKALTAGSLVGPSGFLSTDVGRAIRLQSEPLAWSALTAYVAGNAVTWQGTYYTCLVANTNSQPDQNLTNWEINLSAATWTWGLITSIISATSIDVQIRGPALLYTNVVNNWMLGVYSNTTGWPTCGCYHQGRLWLAGSIGNRVDASNSNDIFNFAPTAADGTVADNNSISAIFDASDVNTIYWMQPAAFGILCGTAGGEWVIQASNLNDPITPTSIQVHRVTKYRSANVEARNTGYATMFVQKEGRKVLEFLADVFNPNRYSAQNLSLTGKHLTKAGIAEIWYQEELTPIIWARGLDGSLYGCTYRRMSAFSTEEPTFAGWHRHTLGSGRSVTSICVGASNGAGYDSLALVTKGADGFYWVEQLTAAFDVEEALSSAWFLDAAVNPSGSYTTVGGNGVAFFGLWHLNGQKITAWVGNLDLGDYTVSQGSITVPFGAANGVFTQAYMDNFSTVNAGQISSVTADYLDVANFNPLPTVLVQASTVQSYIPPSAPAVAYTALPDWANDMVYVFNGAANTISSFQISTGALVLGPVALPSNSQTVGACLSDDGYIYFQVGTTNSRSINRILKSTLGNPGLVPYTFGSLTSTLGPTGWVSGTTYIMSETNSMVCLTVGAEHYIVSASETSFANARFGAIYPGAVSTGTELTVIQATNLLDWPDWDYVIQEGNAPAVLCAGPKTNFPANSPFINIAIAYGMTQTTTVMGLYAVTVMEGTGAVGEAFNLVPGTFTQFYNAGVNAVRIGQVTPSQIDPAWTTFTGLQAILYDQADGNIICGVTALAYTGTPNLNYIIKVNAQTAAVMWAVPVVSQSLNYCNTSRVAGGLIFPCGTPDSAGVGFEQVYCINTLAGTVTLEKIANLYNQYGMAFDGVTGKVLVNADYSDPGAGRGIYGVAPLGNTPALWNNQWCLMTLGQWTGAFSGAAYSVHLSSYTDTANMVIGYTYTTQGQLLRPSLPQDTGAQNGPGFGKVKRIHQYAIQFQDAQGVSIGTTFTAMHTVPLRSAGGTVTLAPYTLFSGQVWDTVEDAGAYFDSQLAWQVTRPYPCTVTALGGYIQSQDR